MQPAQLAQAFPEKSGNFKMDNFLPAWYLLEHHKGASCVFSFPVKFANFCSLSELRRGFAELEASGTTMVETSTAPRDVVKNNLHSYIACVDALDNARERLDKHKDNWPITKELHQLVRF